MRQEAGKSPASPEDLIYSLAFRKKEWNLTDIFPMSGCSRPSSPVVPDLQEGQCPGAACGAGLANAWLPDG